MKNLRPKIKKTLGGIIVFENNEAVDINAEEIEKFTREFILLLKKSPHYEFLSKSKFAVDRELILKLNREIIENIDKIFLKNFVKAIKKSTMFSLRRIHMPRINNYFSAVADIFTRERFLKQLDRQLKSERHLHGIARGIVKHLWAVSLLGFFSVHNKELRMLLARAGIYHDITLKKTKKIFADYEHPQTGARLTKYLGEPDEIVFAVRDHLSLHCLKNKKLPRNRVGRFLLKYDTLTSTSERFFSLGKKVLDTGKKIKLESFKKSFTKRRKIGTNQIEEM